MEKQKKEKQAKEKKKNFLQRYIAKRQEILRREYDDEIREKAFLRSMRLQTSTQMMIPIKDVFNGCILLEDGTYVKIMEVYPANFDLIPPSEQEEILVRFHRFIIAAPAKIHFKSITKQANIDKYIRTVREEQKQERVAICKSRYSDLLQLVKEVSENGALSQRFFLILHLDPKAEPMLRQDDVYACTARLNQAMADAGAILKQVGNHPIEIEEGMEDYATAEILYALLCRGQKDEVSYQDHALEVIQKYCEEAGEPITGDAPYIPAKELVAPYVIDLTHSDYFMIDNRYYIVGVIPSNSYPTEVMSNWMSVMVNAGEGVDVDLFMEKTEAQDMVLKLRRQNSRNELAMHESSATSDNFANASNAATASNYLLTGIRQGDRFLYMSILVTVSADTLGFAKEKFRELQKNMLLAQLKLEPVRWHQKEAYTAVFPFGWISPNLFKRTKQNMLAIDASSAYIYTSFSKCDAHGMFIGLNLQNRTPVILDMYDTSQYRNANMAIWGSSGAGKTFLLQCISMRLRLKHIQVFAILPKKGVEYKRGCDAVGGQYVLVSGASQNIINIMEIRRPDDQSMKLLYGEGTEQSLLAQKVDSVKTFCSLLMPSITDDELTGLDAALVKTFGRFGITKDNRTLDDPFAPGYFKAMPVLGDLEEVLNEDPDMHRVAKKIHATIHGSGTAFNGQTNVDLNNDYIVFDLDALSKDLMGAGMWLVLDFLMPKVKEDKTKLKAVIMDELWSLIGAGGNTSAAEAVVELHKLIRGYGGGIITATQDLNDLQAYEEGKFGKAILNACTFKFVLGMEKTEADSVQEALELGDAEIEQVKNFKRGKALVCVNHTNIPVEIVGSNSELELYSTDPKIMRALAEKKRRQQAMMA